MKTVFAIAAAAALGFSAAATAQEGTLKKIKDAGGVAILKKKDPIRLVHIG